MSWSTSALRQNPQMCKYLGIVIPPSPVRMHNTIWDCQIRRLVRRRAD